MCAALGVLTATGVAYAIATGVGASLNNTQVCHLFVKWDRPWCCTAIRQRGVTTLAWGELRTEPGATPEATVEAAWAELEPRVVAVPGRRMSNEPPSWGSLAGRAPPARTAAENYDVALGWPVPCLWWRLQIDDGGFTVVKEGCWSITGGVPRQYPTDPALPLWVLWPALALDSTLYGAVWALVLFAPGSIRRMLRRRDRRCTGCGYDLRGLASARCPECGDAYF